MRHDVPKMPTWKPPKNITKALEDGDGSWEDERWSPILLTAMSGTELDGREILVAWQIDCRALLEATWKLLFNP
jgi:hypothetical protein